MAKNNDIASVLHLKKTSPIGWLPLWMSVGNQRASNPINPAREISTWHYLQPFKSRSTK